MYNKIHNYYNYKKFKPFLFRSFSILFLVIFFSTSTKVFALDWPYAPGATLDPGCSPGSTDCVVEIPSSMVYPGLGIPISTGSAWGTSITDNSTNWNTAYGWGNHASGGYLLATGATVGATSQAQAFTNGLISPTVTGGTSTTQDLTFQTTSGVGATGADMHFLVGNNGGTEAMTILNSGSIGIGTTTPTAKLDIQGTTAMDLPTYSAEFLLDTGWTSTGWTGDFATGWTHTIGNTSVLSQSKVAVNATKYQIAYTVTGRTAGSFTIGFGGQTSSAITATGAWGPTTSSTASLTITPTTDFDGKIVISIKSITAISTPIINLKSSDGIAKIEIRAGTASGNIFIGSGGAGRYNTTGTGNSAQGYQSLSYNTTGTGNSAQGYSSLFTNITGSQNSAHGAYSLNSNTIGSQNSAQGYQSLYSNTTGSYNSALGYQAGRYIANGATGRTTGDYGLYLGYDAKASADGTTNEIVIGYNAIGAGSNTIQLGNTSILRTYAKGLNLGAGSATAGTAPLKFTSGTLLTTPEAGAIEFLTDAYYGTITTGGARKTFAFLESPAFTTPNIGVATATSLTSPTILGGTSTTQDLTLQTTSGVGATGADMHFLVGNNGATEAMTILNDGNVGINTLAPTYHLDVKGTSATDGIRSDMGFDIYQVPNPGTPTGVVSAGGSVDTGTHYYWVTYTTALGETNSTGSAVITTTAGNNTVTLTIPISTDPRVTGRKIYRTKAGASSFQDYLLATIANNTDVSYVDTVADSTLAGTVGSGYYRTNTTSNNISLNGSRALTIDRNGTYLGIGAGSAITSGGLNSLLGYYAGYRITTGSYNSLLGDNAGVYITTGQGNTALGESAGGRNSTGTNNTTIGWRSLGYGTAGGTNLSLVTSVGSNAGYNMTGSYNSMLGAHSAYGVTSGTYGTYLGYQAGRYLGDGVTSYVGTGAGNIFIGSDSRANANADANEIVIGYNAIGNGSNTTTIGTGNVLYIGGAGITGKSARFTNSAGYCDIDPLTTALVCTSDINLKKNITTLDKENNEFLLNENITIPETTLEKILALNPVLYNWNTEDDTALKHIGLIAQEVEQLFPSVVMTDEKTGIKSIAYSNFIPYTIEAIKEMNLKLLEINNIDTPNSWRDSFIAWFGNEMNGIVEFVAGTIRAKDRICIGDGGEKICVSKEELLQIKNNLNILNNSSFNETESEINTVIKAEDLSIEENVIGDPFIEEIQTEESITEESVVETIPVKEPEPELKIEIKEEIANEMIS